MDKNKCSSCGETKCSCKNKDFTKAVIEIDNPEQITLMRKVVIPVSMGDDTTVPPVVGKYHNVLLFYEANSKSYLYSSDGIPTLLANGLTDYEQAVNLPQINGVTLIGDKTLSELGLNAFVFDTVADMSASTELKNGDYAKTLGYYSLNDEGGAYYKISSTVPSSYYETLTSGLYAELIIEPTMSVRQFGAKGDGAADDTTAVQIALDNASSVFVPTGTYMVDAVTKIKLNSNNVLHLDNDATIKAITNDATSYGVLWLEDVTNVEISGGTIEGDRLTHTGSDGEWGHCIRIYKDCDQIYIHDINLINAWGDGLSCGKVTGSVRTERVHVNNTRRNGYSIASVKSFISSNDIIENVSGTAPQCGVDIEPDTGTDILDNIIFDNLITRNNAKIGVQIHLTVNPASSVNIVLNNHHDYGSQSGLQINKIPAIKGNIVVNDCYYENSVEAGINLSKCYAGDCLVKIIRPVILNCNTNAVSSIYGSAIIGNLLSGSDSGSLGDIEIIEPYTTNATGATEQFISLRSYLSDVPQRTKNIKIINPLNNDGKNCYVDPGENVTISDKYNVMQYSSSGTVTLYRGTRYSVYTNKSDTSGDRIFTLQEATSNLADVGRKVKVMNINQTYKLSLKLGDSVYCRQLSASPAPKINLEHYGDYIELVKLAPDEYAVSSWNCTPTVS